MKYTFLLFFFSYFAQVSAQNLVPNPSFEDMGGKTYIFIDFPDTLLNEPVPGWTKPTWHGTPDYFSVFSQMPSNSATNFNVPENGFAYQWPHTGSAYMGINVQSSSVLGYDNWREHLQSKLQKPLTAGESYCIGFYSNLAYGSSYSNGGISISKGWGMELTQNRIKSISTDFQSLEINIPNPDLIVTDFITDTMGWTLVNKVFTASGGEEWLTIGNFKQFGQSEYDFLDPSDSLYGDRSYYFFDDVFVIPMNSTGVLGKDTTVCTSSFPLKLTGPSYFNDYQWSTGQTNINEIEITQPGTYYVQTQLGACLLKDTIVVEAIESGYNAKDTILCAENGIAPFNLPGGNDISQIQWSNGDTGPSTTFTSDGLVWYQANTDCGPVVDSFMVNFSERPEFSLGPDIDACLEGSFTSITLTPDTLYANFSWSIGATSESIVADKAGLYYLTVFDSVCQETRDSVIILGCEPRIFVPDVFRPTSINKDNQVFKPFVANATVVGLSVFDRWGNQLHLETDTVLGWDGTFRGVESPQAVYGFIVNYIADDTLEVKQIAGSVLLLR